MSLIFANPAGWWALAGIPVLVAIHFLQPRSRRARATTLFLLDHLPPVTTSGRTWRWLRSSWALWLQLVAVITLAWLLAEPRWQRPDSVQTIAIALDSSASMRAFRDDAIATLRDRMPRWAHNAARTEWILRETEPARPLLYRGYDRAAALDSLARWRPDLGTHDFAPVLASLRQVVRQAGAAILLTDRRPHGVDLTGVALIAVGRPIANVGFASGTATLDPDGRPQWSIVVHASGPQPTTRGLSISRRDGSVVATHDLALPAGAITTIHGAFPTSTDALIFRLDHDGFDFDDTIPLVAAGPRALSWRVVGQESDTTFFRRFLTRTPAMRPALGDTSADVVILLSPALTTTASPPGALLQITALAPTEKPSHLATAPIVAEQNSFVDGLAWSGLLSPGPAAETLPVGAHALLWQGERPLAWLDTNAATTRVTLAWDWAASNADRLPASAVLLDRLVEDARARKLAPESANFDTNQRIDLPLTAVATGDVSWSLDVDGTRKAIAGADLTALRAPRDPGFFKLTRGDSTLIDGATQFADPREADFTDAETVSEPAVIEFDTTQSATVDEHLRPLWFLLLVTVLVASWAAVAPRRGSLASQP